ncbi:hypothetical protein GCM10027185_21590 [Spirosoma pulveris]
MFTFWGRLSYVGFVTAYPFYNPSADNRLLPAQPVIYMKFLYSILFLSGLIFTLSCQRQACQNPPPAYTVAFTNAQGQAFINDSLQAATLRLSSISSAGVRTVLSPVDFRPVASNDRYKFVYQVGYSLFDKNEQNRFTVELNNNALGSLELKSQRDNSKCDGWMHLTEVRFNDQVVGRSADNVTYAIKLNL